MIEGVSFIFYTWKHLKSSGWSLFFYLKFSRNYTEKIAFLEHLLILLCIRRRGGGCIKAPLPAVHVVADVEELTKPTCTPVAVDQRAANCLEEAVRSFTAMRNRHRSSGADINFRRPLPVFRVVRCSSVHCFQTRNTMELFRCYCAIGNPPSRRQIILPLTP